MRDRKSVYLQMTAATLNGFEPRIRIFYWSVTVCGLDRAVTTVCRQYIKQARPSQVL
jgi:hypothetical protein